MTAKGGCVASGKAAAAHGVSQNKSPWAACWRPRDFCFFCRCLVGFGDGQGFVDVVMRTIDVLENASLEAAGFGIVFFLRYIVMGLVQEVAGLVQVSAPGQVRVDRFVLVDVFAIVDRGFLDFIDGVIDFFDGLTLFDVNRAAVGTMLEMGPRVPQIGESVDVRRMTTLRVDILGGQREKKSKSRGHQGKTGQSLHANYHLMWNWFY
jgi:hypothetical protein